ncbi:MAG: YbaN family protein [Magnetococcales bacterium]|nr:YbaN family protein [Magnetococcales bacterium]
MRADLVRMLFLLLGLLFVGLGLIGAFLPVLPTTPFMIVALACFARSSQRFHDWLFSHPLFGPTLQQWHHHRVIPPMAKAASVTAMMGSMIYVAAFSNAPWYLVTAMGLFIAFSAWFILSKPGTPPASEARKETSCISSLWTKWNR